MLVAAFPHEVAEALVQGDAGRSNQAWHAGDYAVIARRNHVGAGPQDGHELEHIVVIGSEYRRAGQKLLHRAASVRIQPLHGYKNREDAMAFAEGRRGFAEGRDVAAVFGGPYRAGTRKNNRS